MRFLKIIVFAVLLAPIIVLAQPGEDEGSGFEQTQVITGDRTLAVQKTYKMSDMPQPIEIPADITELEYQLIPKRPAIAITPDTIEPAKVKVREPLEKLYKGFVKAGVGTFATPYAEAVYTSTRDRDFAYGVHARHLSANDGINQPVAFSGFSENKIHLWGKKVYRRHSLHAEIGYDRNVNYYYGFDPQDRDIDKKEFRQGFNDFSLKTGYKSYYRDSSRINHDIGLDGYFMEDRYGSHEFGVDASASLNTVRGNQFYTLETGLDFISYRADRLSAFSFLENKAGATIAETNNNNAIFHLAPQILLTSGNLRALAGLAIYGQFDDIARFHAFPDLEVSYSLFDDIFIPYAGITGKVKRNSYRTLTRENPFILSNTRLENSVVKYDIFGGIRGSISDHVSFNTRVGFDRTNATPLYVNDTIVSRENRFGIIYDRVETFSMKGEISYQNNDKWGLRASGEWFSYSTEDEDEAWHLPQYRFALRADYNLFDKFLLGTEMALIGNRQVKSFFPVDDIQQQPAGHYIVELDPYFDMSLDIEYRYSDRLSAFVELNNLTGTNYDQYYRFPVQRIFVLGGLKFAF
jgi:hypothetical protein